MEYREPWTTLGRVLTGPALSDIWEKGLTKHARRRLGIVAEHANGNNLLRAAVKRVDVGL